MNAQWTHLFEKKTGLDVMQTHPLYFIVHVNTIIRAVFTSTNYVFRVEAHTHSPHELHPSPMARRLLDSLLARFDPSARELDYRCHCLRTRRRHSRSTLGIKRRRNHDCACKTSGRISYFRTRKVRSTPIYGTRSLPKTLDDSRVHTGYDKAGERGHTEPLQIWWLTACLSPCDRNYMQGPPILTFPEAFPANYAGNRLWVASYNLPACYLPAHYLPSCSASAKKCSCCIVTLWSWSQSPSPEQFMLFSHCINC